MFDAGAVVGRLEMNIKGWETAVKKIKDDQASLSGLVLRHSDEVKKLGTAFTAAGAAIVGSLGLMVKKTADAGDAINDMAQRTGIATEILSGYKLAADKSGTSLDGFATGMKGLSRVMEDAASGGKESAEAFKSIGVSVTDSKGQLRPLNDVFLDIADVLSKMPDGAEKNALAMKLLGKSGMDLIPMLNMGKQGLQENYDVTKKLGGLWSKEAAQAADRFNDSLAELKMGGAGLGKEIATALMPSIQGLVENVTGIIAKVREWAAEHPGLVSTLSKVTLGLGLLLGAIGPVVIALPGLIKLITAIKMLSGQIFTFTFAIAGTAIVAAGVAKMIQDFNRLKEEGKTTAEALKTQFLNLNPFKGLSRENLADFLEGMEDANALSKLYAQEGGRATRDVVLEEKEAFNGLVPPVKTLAEELNLLLRVDLEKKYRNMIRALSEYKGQLTDTGTRKLIDEIIELGRELDGTTPAAVKFEGAIQGIFDRIAESMDDAEVGRISEEFSEMARKMQEEFEKSTQGITENILALQVPAEIMEARLKAIGDALGVSVNTIILAFYNLRAEMLRAIGILIPTLDLIPETSNEAARETKSAWSEVSTVVSDALRNIASAVAELINFRRLFGAEARTPEFDSSPYEAMVEAATSAYEKVKSEIESSVEALRAATDKEIDLVRKKYDAMEEAARKSYSAEELARSRAEQDQDIRRRRAEEAQDRIYEARYERERKAIENSSMSQSQRNAALLELEKRYEAERRAREQAREDADLARERRREDQRLKRQEAQERRLEAIRVEGARKEQELRDASAAKQQAFLERLLNLQKQHELDLEAIRKQEDAARQKLADDEERRQNSLWFKVKNIFATAVEQMATIFLTKLLEPVGGMIEKLAAKLVKKGAGSVADALDGVGGKVKGLGATIGEFIGGIGAGIGGFVAGLASGIATALVTLATGVASAATIIAAAAPAIIVTSLLAAGVMAGLNLLKRIFSSGAGSGAGDGMGRVVERQDQQTAILRTILEFCRVNINEISRDIIRALETISVGEVRNIFSDARGYLMRINDEKLPGVLQRMNSEGRLLERIAKATEATVTAIRGIKGAAGGFSGLLEEPTMFIGGEAGPEQLTIEPIRRGTATRASGGAAWQSQPIRLELPIYIGGRLLTKEVVEIVETESYLGRLHLHPKAVRAQC